LKNKFENDWSGLLFRQCNYVIYAHIIIHFQIWGKWFNLSKQSSSRLFFAMVQDEVNAIKSAKVTGCGLDGFLEHGDRFAMRHGTYERLNVSVNRGIQGKRIEIFQEGFVVNESYKM
jgi:hypothetical protein